MAYKIKYPCATNKINHRPPIIPTSAQAKAGHITSACAFNVAFAAPAVIPVKADDGVKKSVWRSATTLSHPPASSLSFTLELRGGGR